MLNIITHKYTSNIIITERMMIEVFHANNQDVKS